MTEPRKVALKSVGPPPVSSAKNKNKKEDRPTVVKSRRLNLTLTESNDDTCPEFSYLELCNVDDTNPLSEVPPPEYDPDDPFALGDQAAHDKLVSLAKKYEQKYTPKPGKRKRKDRVRDLVDLGDGYDDEDSFVDNSEAYDEYMPCSVSTKYGGFYINSGRLDIVPVDDESNDDVMPCRKKARKMNSLSDSEESHSPSDDDEEEPKRKTPIKKRNGKDLTGFNVVKKRIKKSFAPTKVVKKSLAVVKRLNGVEKLDVPKVSVVAKPVPVHTQPLPAVVQPLAMVANHCAQLQSSGPTSGNPLPTDAEKLFTCTVRLSRSNSGLPSEKSDNPNQFDVDEIRDINSTINDVVLNANASPSCYKDKLVSKDKPNIGVKLKELVVKIETAASASEGGKIKQFTPELNELLQRIDDLTRSSSSHVRSHLMTSLGAHFACGKDGLMKRALKRNLNQNDVRMKDATTKLKEAVRVALQPLLEKYNSSKTIHAATTDDKKPADGANTPSRKVFMWTDAIRQLLCRVVRIRLEKYEISKRRGETARSYLEAFLDASIKPLWEDGWVRTSELMRESRSAHARWTVETTASSKSESVLFVSTTPNNDGRKRTDGKSGGSSPDDSPVMIDVAVEKPLRHGKESNAIASERTTAVNKVPQPRRSSSNGDLKHSNKTKQLSTAQGKTLNKPASNEHMVIDLTDDVIDTSQAHETKEDSAKLKPNNVVFWSKCLDKDEDSKTTAEYEKPLKKYTKYYAENDSIVDSSVSAAGSPTPALSGIENRPTRSTILTGKTNDNASKMNEESIKKTAEKLIADAGYGPLISRSNSPADGRSVRSSNSNTVVANKASDSKSTSSGPKATVSKETTVRQSSGKVVAVNGHDSTNSSKNRQTLPPKIVGNKPPTTTEPTKENSKSVKDSVQPVALWCTADLTASALAGGAPVPGAAPAAPPLVGLAGSAANQSSLKGNGYSGLPGGCETATLQKKSPVALESSP